MASEDTRPKVRMLLTIGIVSVSLLVGIKFILDSYYLDMVEGYEHELLPKTELLDKTRAEQRAVIDKGENGNIPVSVAMQMIAQKGRDNASPLITATPSEDVGPLTGWAKLPHQLHLPPQVMTTAPPPPPPPMLMPFGDAGAHMTDAGATMRPPTAPNAPRDAGAHIVPHPPTDAPKDGGP